MSLYIGNQKLGSLYLGSTKIKEAWVGDVKVYGSGDPYNPLGLPPFTIRCKFTQGYTPAMGDSQTLVDAIENVWDIINNSTDWTRVFDSNANILEVLGANTTGVTWMWSLFQDCTSMTSVRIFDTSSCGTMATMFSGCNALTTIPLFDTSSCRNMLYTFSGCVNVQSGALALYQQASTQSTVPTHYRSTFRNCGINTTTGLAELQQIPQSWGGLAPG